MDDQLELDPLFSAPVDAAEQNVPDFYGGPASDAAFSETLWYAAIRAHVTTAPALN